MKEVLENWSDGMPSWVFNILIAVGAVLVGFVVKFIINALLKIYKNQENYSLFKSIITHIGRPLNHFIPLFVLNLAMPLMEMPPKIFSWVNHLVEIALVISFASLLISSIKVFEDYMYHMYDLKKEDNLKERKVRTQLQFIRRVVVTMIVVITLAIILLSFDNVRRLGAGLLTGVGIGGIIIGFAAQKSLSNFLAGFQIAFTQPIRIDDVLVVEGEWGRVEDITLTYVVLAIWDQRRLILPINYFIEKPFQNWTRSTSQILGTVFLYLDYRVPLEELRAEFDRIIEANKLWDKRVKVVQVTDARESTVEVRFLMSSRNSSEAFDLRCFIRENMIAFVRDNYPGSLPTQRLLLEGDKVDLEKVNHQDLPAEGK